MNKTLAFLRDLAVNKFLNRSQKLLVPVHPITVAMLYKNAKRNL